MRQEERQEEVAFPSSSGRVGYVLAAEEHAAPALVDYACLAEQAGFDFLFLSDHFHPWNLQQGHSSFVWSVLGALALKTRNVQLFTAVTCPILRWHPTSLAQAASTVYHLSEGRFSLGLGTGEALNERVLGAGFPPFEERLARLRESTEFLRELLRGETVDRAGQYFRVERAKLFDAAPELSIYFASSGPRSAGLAGDLADGLICLGSRPELLQAYKEGGGAGERLAQLSVCWAETPSEAAQTAHRFFPELCLEGTLFTQLATPEEFTEAGRHVSVDDVAASIVCGPDPEPYLAEIEACFEAGYEGVALHQVGPDQRGFLEFWERELRPNLERVLS